MRAAAAAGLAVAAGPSIFFPEAPTAAWPLPPDQSHAHAGQGRALRRPHWSVLEAWTTPSGLTTPFPAAGRWTRLSQAPRRTQGSFTPTPPTCNVRLLSTYCVPGPGLNKRLTNLITFNSQSNRLRQVLLLSFPILWRKKLNLRDLSSLGRDKKSHFTCLPPLTAEKFPPQIFHPCLEESTQDYCKGSGD